MLFGFPGNVELNGSEVWIVDGTWMEGQCITAAISLCRSQPLPTKLFVNHVQLPFSVNGTAIIFNVTFSDSGELNLAPFAPSQWVYGSWSSDNSMFSGKAMVPSWVIKQLEARNTTYNISWSSDEAMTPWLSPGRLLLRLASDQATSIYNGNFTLSIDDQVVSLLPGYNERHLNGKLSGTATFGGFWADVTSFFKTKTTASIQLLCNPGVGFYVTGLVFDNVEVQMANVPYPC